MSASAAPDSPFSSRSQHPFAAIVLVGRTAADLWRGSELVKSLLFWEMDNLVACVLVEDSRHPLGLRELLRFPPSCEVLVLQNPVTHGRGGWCQGLGSWLGTVSAGILKAMAWIHARADAGFVVRLDADALVIGPFAASMQAHIARRPTAGVLGSRGLSCNPQIRELQDLTLESRLSRAFRLWPRSDEIPAQDDPIEVEGFSRIPLDCLARFDRRRAQIARAIANGYRQNEYCQGGACAVSKHMLDLMADAGYLASPEYWHGLPFPDDVVLAMYARAVALDLCDCSAPGEPFGVQHQGLPYPPEILAERGHALIHSVRNDSHYTEREIRNFFRDRQTRLARGPEFYASRDAAASV